MDDPQTPDAKECYDRAMALTDDGQYDQAIELFTRVLSLQPDYPEAYLHRGRCYDRKADHDRAIADFNEAIRCNPTHGKLYLMRGVAYQRREQYEECIADYTKALDLEPTLDAAQAQRSLVRMSRDQCELALFPPLGHSYLKAAYTQPGDFV